MNNPLLTIYTLILLVLTLLSPSTTRADGELFNQVKPLSPQAALKTIQLQDGYYLQLVAAEPLVNEPVLIAWDANGRMFVAEMSTYMQDIDGKNQHAPKGKVVLLTDTNNDGVMDKRTVFVDNLVLPRMVLPLDDRIIIRETNTLDLWSYRDTDGDGVADEKKRFFKGGRRGGNLEHQPSGLIWNIDNYIYTTYSRHRFRIRNNTMIKEPLPHGAGQWGLAKDDYGKIFYSSAGGENPATDFQQPIKYGKISMPGEQASGFREVWPIDNIPDTQGGRGRLRANNSLNRFTASCGQTIFRGDRLPKELYGNLFIPEPVGRLIRRATVTNHQGKTVVTNAYNKKEFIASTDPNFRPLNMDTGPDGTLYIVDMYRGIIQEGNWVRRGSYLRKVVQKYGLDRNIGRGRIYRLRHKDFKPGPQPKLLKAPSSKLVKHLAHPNGWWRDTAQKLIILRNDKSTIPALTSLAQDASNHLAQIHALWTLEGLDAVTPALIQSAAKAKHPQVKIAALRIAEQLIDKNPKLTALLLNHAKSNNPNVAIQALLSAQYTDSPNLELVVNAALKSNPDNQPLKHITQTYRANLQRIRAERERQRQLERINKHLAKNIAQGKQIYATLCIACHGTDGKGTPTPGMPNVRLAPPLNRSPRVIGNEQRLVRILLHGLTGPVDGKTYIQQMVPMNTYDDQWIAAVLTYIRNDFDNKAPLIDAQTVKQIRKASIKRKTQWTLPELLKYDPLIRNRKQWKLTASHGQNETRSAIDGNLNSRWSTGTPMRPGMWFQIKLPKPKLIQAIQLNAASSTGDYPRGYTVTISNDGKNWSKPIKTGHGFSPKTLIKFKPVKTKFIRITQTGRTQGLFWSIHHLDLLAAFNN